MGNLRPSQIALLPPSTASDVVPILVWLVAVAFETVRGAVRVGAGADDRACTLYSQCLPPIFHSRSSWEVLVENNSRRGYVPD